MISLDRRSWADAAEVDNLTGWIEISETGFDASIAWGVPRGCLGRRPVDDSARLIHGYEERPDGSTVPFTRSFERRDRERLEDHVNWYLREAGLPGRPPGFTWFIRESGKYGADTAERIADLIIKRGGSDPERVVDDLLAVIPQVYI